MDDADRIRLLEGKLANIIAGTMVEIVTEYTMADYNLRGLVNTLIAKKVGEDDAALIIAQFCYMRDRILTQMQAKAGGHGLN